MKIAPIALLSLLLPACAHAAVRPASSLPLVSGALLSTNLNAAVVRLDALMGTSAGGAFDSGNHTIPVLCPGGDCGTAPVMALPGCATSPENPTALLGVLGIAGLLLGRLLYRRRWVSAPAA